MHSALAAWTAPAPRFAREADRWAARQGRRERKAPGKPVQRPDPAAGDLGTHRLSPIPTMAAHLPQESEEPLPVCLGTLGAGSPRSRPELGGVFSCVEDAFENKMLQQDALGGGCRGPRAGEPYSGPLGDPEGPREPGGDHWETHGPQQVVATAWRLRVTGPVREDAGPGLLKTSHTRVGRQLGRGLGSSFQAPRTPPRGHEGSQQGLSTCSVESGPGASLSYILPPSATLHPWFWPLPPRSWVSGPCWALGSCLFLCVSVGLAVSFYLCVSLHLLSCLKLRARAARGANLRGGVSTMGPWGQCATRPRPPSKDLGFGGRHLPDRVWLPERLGLHSTLGFILGFLGSPGGWHWVFSRPGDFA